MARHLYTTTLLAVAAIVASAASAQAASLYPDLETFSPRELRFDRTDVSVEGSGQMHNVLRFSNTVYNRGEGRLEVRGQIDPVTKAGPAIQRIFDDAGGFTEQNVGQFYYHAPHQHWHYDDWGNYQLWTKAEFDAWLASGRQQGAADAIGTKTTSCVMDEEFIDDLPGTPYPARYPSSGCSPNGQGLMTQGLSPGWGDTYDYWRFEQWIDLNQTNLANGQYVLRSVTDPQNKVYESANKADAAREGVVDNEAITVLTVQDGNILDSTKPSGTVTINDVDASTASKNVTVKVIGRDDVSGVDTVRLSNNGTTWSNPIPYTSTGSTATSISWDLTNPAYGGTSTGGTKTVYAQFHDRTGKLSDSETDTITYTGGGGGGTSVYSNAVLSDSPAGYWRLGEASGTTATDSAASNHGTYTNAPQLGAASLISSDTANKSVRFDGVNDHVAIPNSGSISPTARVSLEAWIKPAALPGTGSFATIASKREAYALQFNGPRLEFTIMQGGVRRRAQAAVGAIQTGQTYHVAGTYDGTTSRLYINGTEVAALPLTGAIGTTSAGLNIASWTGGNEFLNGTVDDVAVYPTALTAARVKAHSDLGGTAPPPPPPVAAPSNLNATAASSSQVDLTWTDNATNETEFVLERSTSASFTSPTAIQIPENATSYSDTGRAASTTYYYRLKAQNAQAVSGWSNSANATTQGGPPPVIAAPTSLTATPISSSQINLAWIDNANNETGYTLERSADSGFTSPTSIALPANAASYSDTGRAASTTYYYRVRAQNATAVSSWSNTANATTQGTTPPPSSYAGAVGADNPLAWWRLGEASGTTAVDQKAANPGTYLNGPVLGAAGLIASDPTNKAVSFDGANDHVRVPNSLGLQLTTPLTLEAWIRPTALPAAGGFASIVSKPEQYSLQFNGPLLEFTIIQMGARRRLQAPAGTVAINGTYHVVGTFDGVTRRLYVNGTQVAASPLTGGATATANNVFMGSWSGSNEFLRGTIDEVAIYNTALSAARVQAHRTAGG